MGAFDQFSQPPYTGKIIGADQTPTNPLAGGGPGLPGQPDYMPDYLAMPPQGATPRPESSSPGATPIPMRPTDTGPASSPAAAPSLPEPSKEEVGQMVEKAKKAPADVKKAVGEQGFDFNKAFDQWIEKFGGLVDPKTKLSKQEKGIFLMEFGLRMMAAAQDNSALAAAGIAGVPVMQQIGGLPGQRRAQNMEVLQGAMKGVEGEAMMRRAQMDEDIARQRLELEREKLGRISGSDVIWTDKGGVIIGPDGKPQYLTDAEGNNLMPGQTPGAGTKRYANQWLYDMLTDPNIGGMTPSESIQIVAGGQPPLRHRQEGQRRLQDALKNVNDNNPSLVPPGATEAKRWRQFTPQEKEAWKQQFMDQWMAGSAGSRPGGAIGGSPDPAGILGGGTQ